MGYRGEIMAKFKPVMGSYETILELLWKSRIGLFLGKMGQHLPSQKNL